MDRYDLTGKTALVTGASRGIGRAIALGLAQHGAAVAIHYAARVEDAEAVAGEVRNIGGKAITVGGNLAQHDAPKAIFEDCMAKLGTLDILVLNASVQHRVEWQNITPEQFDEQVNVNFRASLVLMQLAIPRMQERKWGRVLTVGSVQQVKPHPFMAVYAATKNAQVSLVRNIAKQVAGSGVTVNNLAPGVIDTDRNADALADPAIRHRVRSSIPVGFIGESEDCVGAAILLCSNAGRYITGADFMVDGGFGLS